MLNTNASPKVPACRSTGSEPICTLSVQLLKEDANGKSNIETFRIAYRQEGTAQGQSFIQAPLAPAVVDG
jgi:hypothetical protein